MHDCPSAVRLIALAQWPEPVHQTWRLADFAYVAVLYNEQARPEEAQRDQSCAKLGVKAAAKSITIS